MDQHEAHAEAIRSNNLLLKGTYEDGYKAGFKAGREAGMREAAKRCDELWRKWYAKHGGNTAFDAAYTTALQNASSAILSAIGGEK